MHVLYVLYVCMYLKEDYKVLEFMYKIDEVITQTVMK